ncbi:hypothetical protein JVU11DRAFT_1317 [Chiua virens]|nr:hypothetical protein JVU11DRAFT_1317 [Chiua virens]
MCIPLITGFFLFFGVVIAHPLPHNTTPDIKILAFANLVEQLESAFYAQALEIFSSSDFETAGFASSQIPIQQFEMIASDENVHAMTLEVCDIFNFISRGFVKQTLLLQSAIRALGGEVVSNCTFNFSSALTDVNTMVANARVVENVGVSAYLGALTYLTDPALVSAAGSIMTVEARHQTILNLLSNATSVPQPFDVALAPTDVLAIANIFISGLRFKYFRYISRARPSMHRKYTAAC